MSQLLGNKRQQYTSETHIVINSQKEMQALSLIELTPLIELAPTLWYYN